MEETTESQTEPVIEGVKRGRYRKKKNPRLALEEVCDRLEEAINAPNQKVAKAIDGLKQVAAIRLRLLDADAETSHDEALQENIALKTQHEKDTIEIERLGAQVLEIEKLQRRANLAHTSDPDTPGLANLKQQVQELTTLLAFVVSELDAHTRACTGIKAILKWGTASMPLVKSLGLDFQFYWSGLQANSTRGDLQNRLSCCTDADGTNAVYIRAALEVVHSVHSVKPVPRGQSISGGVRDMGSEQHEDMFCD